MLVFNRLERPHDTDITLIHCIVTDYYTCCQMILKLLENMKQLVRQLQVIFLTFNVCLINFFYYINPLSTKVAILRQRNRMKRTIAPDKSTKSCYHLTGPFNPNNISGHVFFQSEEENQVGKV